jgi:hypothetical protein
VEVVKAANAVDCSKGFFKFNHINVFGYALEKDVDARFENYPCSGQYPYPDGDRDNGVSSGPACEPDYDGAGDDPFGTQQNAPSLEITTLYVQAFTPTARKDFYANQVGDQSDRGEPVHPCRVDFRQIPQSTVGLIEDVHGYGDQHHRIEGGRQNLETVKAEVPLAISRPASDSNRCQGDASATASVTGDNAIVSIARELGLQRVKGASRRRFEKPLELAR